MTRRDDEHDDEFPRDEDDETLDEYEALDGHEDDDDDESDLDDEDEDSTEEDEDGEDDWMLEQQPPSPAHDEDDSPARRAGLLRFEEALTLEGQIEAVVFAAPKALKVEEILEIVQTDDMAHTEQAIQAVLDNLEKLYAERNGGFRLEVLKGAYQFQTVPAAAPLMERLFSARPRPLSRAALETLAIIAYRQPVTRADVEFIRGVDAGSIIKNLMERDLIACVGRKEDAGRPMLFGTTQAFLEVFRLNNIKDLPPLSAFQPAQEMVTEAANKLEGEEAIDVEGFVADRENRELSDDEREFLAEEAEDVEALEEDVIDGEALSADEPEEAAELSFEEGEDEDEFEASDEDDEDELEAAHDGDEEGDFETSPVEEEDSSEEESLSVGPESEEEALAAGSESEEPAMAPDPDNPFWELDIAVQKTSKTEERVIEGASAKKRRGAQNDEDGADEASEVGRSTGTGLKTRGRDLDPSG